jgi:predicted TPR repeat methyltransferase
VASVAALVPDLLFGSSVVSLLGAAGHETVLVSALDQLQPGTADVLVVDLTADPQERVEQVQAADLRGVRTIAVYAHVEADVRRLAQEAGFDVVVPRSRFVREGAVLVSRLVDSGS